MGLLSRVEMVNQSDISPRVPANWSPDICTFCLDPTSVNEVTRPPQSPNPLRAVTFNDSKVPSCGQSASMSCTATDAFQVWSGLHAPGTQTESPASGTAGNPSELAPGLV